MNGWSAPYFLEIAFHQLWQGAVLAGCVWLLFKTRRHWSAESRYWVWTAALLLVAALPLLGQLPIPRADFLPEELSPVSLIAPANLFTPVTPPADALIASPPPTRNSSWLSIALLSVWAAGAACRLFSLLSAGYTLQRWRRAARPVAPDQLPLSRAALGNCEVRESTNISVPMVVGVLRPCILLPQGLHARLHRSQLALVLLHESVHARRGDTWLVLLQRLIEAVYFYNPIVLWMSRVIERERECSCDDRAILAAQESSTEYADCLVHVTRQVGRVEAPSLAVGAARSPAHLKLRIERLLSRSDSDDTRVSWRSVAGVSSVLFVVAATLSLSLPHANAANQRAGDPHQQTSARDSGSTVSTALSRQLAETKDANLGSARELIAAGADVDYALPGDGTPLIIAARRGDLPLVQLLIQHGADVNRFSSGDGNPLIMASSSGHMPIVMTLVEHGADVNAQDVYDETPLINAARAGHLQVVDYLIDKGADVNLAVEVDTLRGREIRSPLSEARKHRHDAIVDRLQQRGAKR